MSDDREKKEEYEHEEYSFIKEKIKKQPVNKKKLFVKIGGTAFLAVLFGTVAIITMKVAEPVIGGWFESEEEPPEIQLQVPEPPEAKEEESDEGDAEDTEPEDLLGEYEKMFKELYTIAQKAEKSMVTVTGVRNGTNWYGDSYEEPNPSESSGIIILKTDEEIYILTELSAVQEANTVQVEFNSGHVTRAEVKAFDDSNGIAVVVVRVEDAGYNSVGDIQVAELGTSGIVKRGEVVIALGRPRGVTGTVSYGIVTSKGNTVSTLDAQYKVLTTDIGGTTKSSGVLMNLNGQVVGIVAQKYSNDGQTITALELSDISEEMEMLCAGREIPKLGLEKIATVTDSIAEEHSLAKGVYIAEIMVESPAYHADLQKFDVIVAIDGDEISTVEDYHKKLLEYNVGDAIEIKVMREKAEKTFHIELSSNLFTP